MTLAYIYSKCIKDTNGCLLWAGHKRQGYGFTSLNGKYKSASRIALLLATNKPLDYSLNALHKCNNKACCNINHLYWGTRSQNARDSIEAGTFVFPPRRTGESHPNSKLTREIVLKILDLNREFGHGPNRLSRMLGINRNTINNILYNKARRDSFLR